MISRKLASKFRVTCVSNSVISSYPVRRRTTKFQSFWFQRLFDALLQLCAASWDIIVYLCGGHLLFGLAGNSFWDWAICPKVWDLGSKTGHCWSKGKEHTEQIEKKKNSFFQPPFELNHHFGICSVIHLSRLINCSCASVVKISYTIDSYKEKAVLVGALTMQESVLHKKKAVLLKDLRTEDGCYQGFKPPWHT